MFRIALSFCLLALLVASLESGALVRAPSGQRMAASSVKHEQGSVSIEYNTLYYGQQTVNDVLSSEKSRQFYNRALPGKIRGKLRTEFDLEVNGERLAKGEHSFSLVVVDQENFGLRFGEDGEVIPLDAGEAPWVFTNLTCVLGSDGAQDVVLAIFYGELAGSLLLEPAGAQK